MAGEMIGHGIVVQMALLSAPTVFTNLENVYDFVPPKITNEDVDVTHYQSPGRVREFIPGLGDPGEASIEMNFVPGNATDIYLRAARGNQRVVRVTYPNGATITFTANVSEYGADALPVDDKLTATVQLKVTGEPTYTAPAAPANTVLPAISGLPQVGVLLTAYPGVWSGGPAFTYQWRRNATNISGATNPTYTPIAGDIGGALSVVVTGTNSTGSANATSVNTINVIA